VVDSSSGLASGYASPRREDFKLKGCNIVIAPRTLEEPRFFTHVLLHELLHCVGLDHQQDDADSIMSYSNNGVGLSADERMALTYMYPLKSSYAKETATFGLACEPSK
jgi:hypothetical protein